VAVSLIVTVTGGGYISDRPAEEVSDASRRRRSSNNVSAMLILGRSRGRPRNLQVDAEGSWPVKWRGPGAMIRGTLGVVDGSVVWTPERAWSSLGATAFQMRLEEIELIERTTINDRLTGIIVHAHGGGEVWMMLANDHAAALHPSLIADEDRR
jgi:hypothetical protein